MEGKNDVGRERALPLSLLAELKQTSFNVFIQIIPAMREPAPQRLPQGYRGVLGITEVDPSCIHSRCGVGGFSRYAFHHGTAAPWEAGDIHMDIYAVIPYLGYMGNVCPMFQDLFCIWEQ